MGKNELQDDGKKEKQIEREVVEGEGRCKQVNEKDRKDIKGERVGKRRQSDRREERKE